MSPAAQLTICIVTSGERLDQFQRCLESVLEHPPDRSFEMRLAFNQAASCFSYALGRLSRAGVQAQYDLLSDGIERFGWTRDGNMPVWAWHAARRVAEGTLAHLLYHDLSLRSEYTLTLAEDAIIAEDWCRELEPIMARGIDYIGRKEWAEYTPTQMEFIQAQPWFVGVSPLSRNGRAGTWYMTGGAMAVRSERLRQVAYPDPSWAAPAGRPHGPRPDILLGEIAHQQGWSQADFKPAHQLLSRSNHASS